MNEVLHIFWPDNAIVRSIIAVLGLGWVAAVVVAVRMAQGIGREHGKLQQLRAQASGLTSEGAQRTILASSPRTYAERLVKGMLLQRGLASARPGDVLGPLADEVALVPQALRPVPNWLLLGGLIATVIGLTSTLSGLGPQIQDALAAANPLKVAESLGTTLQEMRGAFAGTAWGVIAALTLQVLLAWVSGRADRLITDLERFAGEISPAIYPAGTEQHLKSLQQMLEEGRRFYEDTQTRVRETSDRFEKVLTQASTLIASSLKTLETTSADIGKSLLGASGEVRQSAERLTQAARSLDSYQSELKNTYTLFNDMFEKSMAHLQQHADHEVQEIRELQRQFGDSGSHIVAELFKTMELLHQVGGNLQSGTTAYLQSTEAVHTSIRAGFDHFGGQLKGVLATYTSEVNAVSLRLDGLNTHLDSNTQAFRALDKTLKSKDDAEFTRHRDQANTLRALTESAERLTGAFTAVVPEQLRADLGELREELARQGSLVALELTRAGASQEAVARDLLEEQRGLRAQFAAQAAALEKQWSASLAALQAVAEHIEQSDQLTDQARLVQQAERMSSLLHEIQALLAAQPTALQAEHLIQQQDALRRDFAGLTMVEMDRPVAERQAPGPEEARSA